MKNKPPLIEAILSEHILNDNYYRTLFNVFHKEYDVNLFDDPTYALLIKNYKDSLTSRLSEYMDKVYSYEELYQMSLDSNSSLYHRMNTQELNDIISGETKVFSAELRKAFAENDEKKRSMWSSIRDFFTKS